MDSFVRDRLPPPELWPDLIFERPEYRFPDRFNVAEILLDPGRAPADKPALVGRHDVWSYGLLRDRVDRIARVLTREAGLIPGGRVLLRASNGPWLAACWLAVVKAGGVAVTTAPMLRSRELEGVVAKAHVDLALCEDALLDAIEETARQQPVLRRIMGFTELARRIERETGGFKAVGTAATDPCLIAFTSGTTGAPKAAVHLHRDVLAVTRGLPRLLGLGDRDVFCGSPSLAFTYGLGALLLFPLMLGGTSILLERAEADLLGEVAARHGATVLFGVPTAYRRWMDAGFVRPPSLRVCVSAGEILQRPTFERWRDHTGLVPLDTIGSTEMLHTFIATPPDAPRPGATGLVLPGYRAMVVDEDFRPLPPGELGRLVVKGPVGCLYLDDPRQTDYVQRGWNVTGDAYVTDEDGYFWYRSRTDDMIVSAGYNIAGPEVEEALLDHPLVRECAVVAAPDPERGSAPKAFVVVDEKAAATPVLAEELRAWVRSQIAPYKQPRSFIFLDALPRTETGKIQRYKLRELATRGER